MSFWSDGVKRMIFSERQASERHRLHVGAGLPAKAVAHSIEVLAGGPLSLRCGDPTNQLLQRALANAKSVNDRDTV
jgi:hypothetical protein